MMVRMEPSPQPGTKVSQALAAYRASGDRERADLERVRVLLASARDPWTRSIPLHLTASAIVAHLPSNRVLLRWHDRFRRFQQVGGHADPGEEDALEVALREAREETGLTDLRPVERSGRIAGDLVHIAVVPVPSRADEDAHEHADLRFLLETDRPGDASPESPGALLRWMTWDEALALVEEDNQGELLSRCRDLLA
jgi:8-oxo-dGTP pyrophosphatase MutT (NUDIX family)